MLNRVASIQMTSAHDVKHNLEIAKKLIADAAAENARLVVLPEMFALMGVDQLDKVKHKEDISHGLIQDFLYAQARQHKIWIVGGTIPISVSGNENKVHAACLVINDLGECVARYDKVHLFDVYLNSSQETYLESQNVEPGSQVVVVPTPFGRLGLAVCYDLRFPEMFRQMHEQQVEVIAVPAAFTYATGQFHWDILVRARALENLAYVITACQTGTHENKRKTYGHSMIVNPWGMVVACLPEKVGIVVADIDLNYQQKIRQDFPVLSHRKF